MARIVTNSPYNDSALPIIKQLSWQTVNDLTVSETLKMLYKCTNGEDPLYHACLFDRLLKTNIRELQSTETDPCVPFLRTTCAKYAFLLEG